MYLRIKGDSYTADIYKQIAALTDSAQLDINKVYYDEVKRKISLPIERLGVTGKRKFLGSISPYKRNANVVIPSTVIINNISRCNIQNNVSDTGILSVTLLFGVVIEDKEITIISAEEVEHGIPCYMMEIKVDEVDIEIIDK